LFAALRDVVPLFYKSVHVNPQVFLESFKNEIEEALKTVQKFSPQTQNYDQTHSTSLSHNYIILQPHNLFQSNSLIIFLFVSNGSENCEEIMRNN
jgi:hypothetical protein